MGIASLCYARRVSDAEVLGIEIDPELVTIATENAERNRMAQRVRFSAGDVCADVEPALRFDQVFFNPPFHAATGTRSPVDARNEAKRDTGSMVAEFMSAALRVVERGGTITAIVRADRVDDLIAAAMDNAAIVFPLYPRAGAAPKRVIVQVATAVRGGARYGPGLVLHRDSGATPEAEAILRGGEPLMIT